MDFRYFARVGIDPDKRIKEIYSKPYTQKARFNIFDGGHYSDSITEIRKAAIKEAYYDFNNQLSDGPQAIIDTKAKKIYELVTICRVLKADHYHYVPCIVSRDGKVLRELNEDGTLKPRRK